MNNGYKTDSLGFVIDESERTRAIADLKSLARLMRDREKCADSVASCKRSIADASHEVEKVEKEKPVNASADKAAREYADEVLKKTADPRFTAKNTVIFALWVAAFGFLLVTETFAKAFPGMWVKRDLSHYICLIIAYGVVAIGTMGGIFSSGAADKKKNPLKFFIPAVAVTLIAAIPAGIFYGTVATNASQFSITFDQIVDYTLPAFLVSVIALVISAVIDIPMSRLKLSKKQEKAYHAAYTEEYSRLLKENRSKNERFEKSRNTATERLSSLNAKLTKAEAELAKAEEAVERNDTVPEFYKDRDTVSQMIMYLEGFAAGSLPVAARLFEQMRSQRMMIEYQNALSARDKAKAEYEDWKKFGVKYRYEAQDRTKEIDDIKRRAAANREAANDIYRDLGKDKRV
jgi:hypothetical protein